jgi:hypothetical protein
LNDKEVVSSIFLKKLGSSKILHFLIALNHIAFPILKFAKHNSTLSHHESSFLIVPNDDDIRKLPLLLVFEELC